jgi:Tuberculosis necrotizing toxin
MPRLTKVLLLFVALAGMPAIALAQAAPAAPPAGWPPYLLWKLVPKWITWDSSTQKATIRWPDNDGCADKPVDQTLAIGTMIDRFGGTSGSFFSPRGASFNGRATPYVCRQEDYRVYKLVAALPVHTCKAAAWFGLSGGVTQYKTDESAQSLTDKHIIEEVLHEVGGNNLPYPQCGRP